MSILWSNYGYEFQAFKREIEKIEQENLHWDLESPMVMFLGSRLKKSWHKWEVGRENRSAHKKSIFYSVTRILHSKTFSI